LKSLNARKAGFRRIIITPHPIVFYLNLFSYFNSRLINFL
jgi:hypothetical protein